MTVSFIQSMCLCVGMPLWLTVAANAYGVEDYVVRFASTGWDGDREERATLPPDNDPYEDDYWFGDLPDESFVMVIRPKAEEEEEEKKEEAKPKRGTNIVHMTQHRLRRRCNHRHQ
jgi:hypothetical protein